MASGFKEKRTEKKVIEYVVNTMNFR